MQIANQGVQTITIPSCLAPGDYLLRGELIALHGASSQGGAQFYVRVRGISPGKEAKSKSDGMCADHSHGRLWSEEPRNR